MSTIEIKVPDIGDFTDVPVIEVLVKPGDTVKPEDALVTLESDKATMDVPSPAAGVVKSIAVKVGDKVSEGSVVVVLDAAAAAGKGEGGREKGAPASPAPASPASPAAVSPAPSPTRPSPFPLPSSPGSAVEVKVPDIGDFTDVPVIEVLVKPGDTVKPEDALVTLESDKATMDVPSPVAGTIRSVAVKVGDKVSEGSVVVVLDAAATAAAGKGEGGREKGAAEAGKGEGGRGKGAAASPAPVSPASISTASPAPSPTRPSPFPLPSSPDSPASGTAHASPSVRKIARELGVDVSKVTGSGPKGRILVEDLRAFVKKVMSGAAVPSATGTGGAISGGGELNLIPWPKVDFAKYGPVESKPLSRIRKLSGANLARNWVMIPHVTQFDEADITDLEALRVQLNGENAKAGVKVTMLAFLIKASVAALRRFPEFNASLDGENLVLKGYFNIGFAADTPNGLVVPVLKNADQKGVLQIAKEMGELSAKAREGKLGPADMQGGCFSISSLGGIGGTAFTPIINAPEVAILGVSKSAHKPVWDGKAFVPRLMLPLSLSYDHRVIDGAAAARFTTYLGTLLGDLRRAML
ncbi:MAG: dihydrolipoyllysine-residue acetyltransferase [Burkholderiales bacterium]|nr:dihydrolipoyllysine-residue acetyltransferase [Burkholderiales bacterium]MCE7876306.1 dihydrolipoyllysine-residue acetyltransferase [Betaproteobacteria bacterium PRO3]